jgi:uncharacterized Zn-finger protein
MDNKKTTKNTNQFSCENCKFKCSKNSDWERHINTTKHKNGKNDNIITPKNTEFKCECGSVYSYSSGLSRHKKKCNGIKPPTISNDISSNCVITPELIIELIKDNKEMKQLMIEFCKNGVNNNINSNNKS